MAKMNITTTLNFKIVMIVVLLMSAITLYNHLLYWYAEDNKSIQRLIDITNYLDKKKPPNIFIEISTQPSATNVLERDHVVDLNKKLQPFVNDIFMPVSTVKFGFYSLKYESVVAIGPNCDPSMFMDVDPNQFNAISTTTSGQFVKNKSSLLWPNANTMTYIKPITEHGVVVGYVFACRNQDALAAEVWRRTANILLATVLMVLLCIWVFRGLFIKLKEDFRLFGKSILTGKSYHYNCEMAEFNPILKCISEQTQQMMHLDRLNIIGEMAASVAHEIRTPMTIVQGLLESMNTQSTTQNKKFALMIKELKRANSIITEFLSLAKNTVMIFKEYNLNSLIQENFPLLQADATSRNCHIQLTLTPTPNVCIDSTKIKQLLFNMVKNGLDAMPNGGTIHISTKIIASKIFLSITDSGVGIPMKVRQNLGTPFFTTKDYGVGLDLAICYCIAQRHSGRITVESEPGNGTTFTIELPSITS